MISAVNNRVNIGDLTVNALTSLPPELLATAICEWQDPLSITEYYHLGNPLITIIARPLFIQNWDYVEYVLTDRDYLYEHISKNAEKKKLLDTPRGMAWLNYVKRRCYEYFYFYTWGKKCPRCGKNMERKKGKSIAKVADEIYVCKCGYVIPIIPQCGTGVADSLPFNAGRGVHLPPIP